MTVSLGVLASGRGSNLRAILRAVKRGELEAAVKMVVSDNPAAGALDIAREYGVEARYIPYDRSNRTEFESGAIKAFAEYDCGIIILAGFMKLLTPFFVSRHRHRILNIHPALLPDFKGLHAQRQALEAGVEVSGCTVHVVTEELDDGPIVARRSVPVRKDDTEETLSERILEQEHLLFPEAIRLFIEKYNSGG